MGKKGNVIGLLSGLTWAMYTIILYTVLNLYGNAKGDLLSIKGIMLVLITTVLISLVDLFLNVVFEIFVLRRSNLIEEFTLNPIFSSTHLSTRKIHLSSTQ